MRFWPKVDTSGDCWIWLACKDGNGYGQIKVDGRMRKAHRLTFEDTVGPIGPDRQLDHLCRVRSCVNPTHLEPVTSALNTLRGYGPCGINARKTHCKRGHPLSGPNMKLISVGNGYIGRRCLACHSARKRCTS